MSFFRFCHRGIVCVYPWARRVRIDPGEKITFRLDMVAHIAIVTASAACPSNPSLCDLLGGRRTLFFCLPPISITTGRPPQFRWPLCLRPLMCPGFGSVSSEWPRTNQLRLSKLSLGSGREKISSLLETFDGQVDFVT